MRTPADPLAFTGFFSLLLRLGAALQCYDCHGAMGSCNSGQCIGKACIKIEAALNGYSSDKKTVTKGCTFLLEEPSCVKTDLVGVEALRCTCSYDFCNGDRELVKSGLEEGRVNSASPDRTKRTNISSSPTFGMSPNYLVMLIFLCLFITGSFSLLIFNTVCVHLC